MKTIAKNFSLNDMINPIAVKEMRQGVKGKAIAWALIIYLILQLIIIGSFMIFSESMTQNFNMGREVFIALLGVLLGVNLLFVPTITAMRLASERSGENVDLLFITTLKPFSIIWGKTLAASTIALLLFSAALPFMTLTYLLRGLDLPSIFILMGLDFLIVIGCVIFGILLGAMPGGLIAKGFRFLVGIGAMFIVFYALMASSASMIFFGIGSTINTWAFWGPALTFLILALLAIGLMFICAVTIITPPSANRAFLPRLYLLFFWAISAAVTFYWTWKIKDDDVLYIWPVATMFAVSAVFFISIGEREFYGPRLRRLIPQNPLLRIPAFFFYSGAANGTLYCILIGLATFAITWLAKTSFTKTIRFNQWNEVFPIAVGIGFYALTYGLLSLMIKRIFFSRETKFNTALLILLVVSVSFSIVPAIIGFIFTRNPFYDLDPIWFLGNPFVLFFEQRMHDTVLSVTGFLSLCFLILNLPWLVKQILAFKPLTENQPGQTQTQQENITQNDPAQSENENLAKQQANE